MKKTILAIIASGIAISIASCGGQKAGAENSSAENDSLAALPTVYYIKDITPENLVRIYEALGARLKAMSPLKYPRESLPSQISSPLHLSSRT